jgi:hypothetical protein
MSSTFPSETPLNPQPPRRISYSQLYENIGNLVIEKAHSGDPIFQGVFEWAWNKTSLKQKETVTDFPDGKSTKPVAAVGTRSAGDSNGRNSERRT